MTAVISNNNNTVIPLLPLIPWSGNYELVNGYTAFSLALRSSSNVIITVYQSIDGTSIDDQSVYIAKANVFFSIQAQLYYKYCKISLLNSDGIPQTFISFMTRWMSVLPLPLDLSNVSITGTSNVNIVGGTSNVNVIGDTVVYGLNSDYNFYPTVENNTVAIYADGVQGTNITGGWLYDNGATGKINWYLYSNTNANGQTVGSVNSMYAVVNNLSTLGLSQAQNPWIMIYTLPDSGVNATSWYKSKLFFGSNAFTDINGIKLLYTGTDPVGVHPEITGNNRINLLFNLSLSTKPLVDALTESVLFGTLQTTNNTATPSSFNFVFSQFGISWVKVASPLPIEQNAVVVRLQQTSTNSGVRVNPTAISPVRKTGLSNTAQLIATNGFIYGSSMINKSLTTGCWVKLYDKATAPTASDTPFIIQNLENVAQYNLISHNDDYFNMPIVNSLWVRSTLTSADNDTSDATIDCEITAFIGTPYSV
mgnify:CR=1 FL=1